MISFRRATPDISRAPLAGRRDLSLSPPAERRAPQKRIFIRFLARQCRLKIILDGRRCRLSVSCRIILGDSPSYSPVRGVPRHYPLSMSKTVKI